MKPYGLVLAGGGSKGAYQIGAWKAMREIGVRFEAVAGVSIGSINGALIVSDDFNAAKKLWETVTVDKGVKIEEPLPDPENLFSRKNWGVLFKEILRNRGFDASPVKDFLAQFIDEKKVRESGIPFAIVTVQMTQGVNPLELFTTDIPEGQLLDYLLASANIPLANNIGPEGERFLDGGAYDNTPVATLRKNGYNRLVVVDIATIKGVSHNDDFSNSEIVYIRPYNIEDLGASFDFDFELNEMRMQMGYLDAKKAFSYLLGKIFYFEPATFRSMVKKYGPKAMTQLEELAHKLKLERLKIYEEDEFLASLKELYEEDKLRRAQEENPQEAEKNDEDEEETSGGVYSSIKRILSRRKSEPEYPEAQAVLDNIII
ncbi:MAG: patatin-like phospholipase family protein [Acutalibacteraceae bacterium]